MLTAVEKQAGSPGAKTSEKENDKKVSRCNTRGEDDIIRCSECKKQQQNFTGGQKNKGKWHWWARRTSHLLTMGSQRISSLYRRGSQWCREPQGTARLPLSSRGRGCLKRLRVGKSLTTEQVFGRLSGRVWEVEEERVGKRTVGSKSVSRQERISLIV